jgi:hypothetical protein
MALSTAGSNAKRVIAGDYSVPKCERTDFFSTLYAFRCRPGEERTECRFFIATGAGFLAKSPEIKLDRPAAPTSLWARPFKIF